MFKYLTRHEAKTYRYPVSKEIIIENINSIFERSGKFLSESDFNARFTSGDSFEMSVDSSWVAIGNVRMGSILYGQINPSDNGESIIETSVKVRYPLKLIAIVTPLLGFTYLYKGLMSNSLQFIVTGGAFLLGPIISNWFAGISNASIQERFDIYIDKALR
jgi:hypothetical protein